MKFEKEEFRKSLLNSRLSKDPMTIRSAAEQSGISAAAYCRIENGTANPDLSSYAKACKWMNVSLDKFFK